MYTALILYSYSIIFQRLEGIGANLVALHQTMIDSGSQLLNTRDTSSPTKQTKPQLSRKTSPCIVITTAAEDMPARSQKTTTLSDTVSSNSKQGVPSQRDVLHEAKSSSSSFTTVTADNYSKCYCSGPAGFY